MIAALLLMMMTEGPPEWVHVHSAAASKVYLFIPRMKFHTAHNGNQTATFWVRNDYAKASRGLAQDKLKVRLDCTADTIEVLRHVTYDTAGTVVESLTLGGGAAAIPPDSSGSDLRRRVCIEMARIVVK